MSEGHKNVTYTNNTNNILKTSLLLYSIVIHAFCNNIYRHAYSKYIFYYLGINLQMYDTEKNKLRNMLTEVLK